MTSPRRAIGLVGPGHPHRGGIVHHNALIHGALKSAGHSVTAIGYRKLYPRLLFPGTTTIDVSAAPIGAPAVPVLDPVLPWTWKWAVRRLVEAAVEGVALHWWHPFHGPCLGGLVRGLNRKGIRTAFIVHNAEPHDGMPFGEQLTRYALGAADALVAQNQVAVAALRDAFPGRSIACVPHPPYGPRAFGDDIPERRQARAKLGLATDAPVALFFGNVRRYKGLDVLLDALALTEAPPVHLLVAGEFYHDAAALKNRIETELAGRATVLDGYIPNEDVSTVLAASDVVVLPYRRGSQSGVHSLAFGHERPVVATRVGGLPEYVEEDVTGHTVPPEDPGALAKVLEAFFTDDHGQRMEAALRKRSGPASWGEMATRILHALFGEAGSPEHATPLTAGGARR